MTLALLSLSRLAAPAEPAAGTRIADARHGVKHWSDQASQLRWHRRAARREARTMIATHRAQLIGAHLERWGLGRIDRMLTPLLDTGGRSSGAHVRSLAWTTMRRTALGRRVLVGASAVAALSLACVATIAVLAIHFVGP